MAHWIPLVVVIFYIGVLFALYPGVWQSLQPAVSIKYRPRLISSPLSMAMDAPVEAQPENPSSAAMARRVQGAAR